ncbi:MAG: type II toxin-antitoxin system death-on-curing family toxin [Actinomycetota bacterium]|nr:type II toxin-antitoxin system death-on-curing family toxin [Actinomycetota bacterium]
MIYLQLDDLLKIAERTIGTAVVRDSGLLESALVRPQASYFGVDPYPTLEEKAAALLHSLVGSHALIDGNKRLGLAAMIAFLGMNGRRLTMTNDEAYDFVMAVATRELDEATAIADILRPATEPR